MFNPITLEIFYIVTVSYIINTLFLYSGIQVLVSIMNPYIRDFEIGNIKTYSLDQITEVNETLNVNNKNSNLKLIHNNIRSISKNIEEFKLLLQNCEVEFDFIVLTETWRISDISLFHIEGYSTVYNEGNWNQNDGTIIYVKSDFSHNSDIVEINNIKIITTVVDYSSSIDGKKIIISSLYRSPSSCPLEFINTLRTYLNSINISDHDHHILVGDINIDIMVENQQSSEYLNLLSEYGYISMINEYTRVTPTSKTCIDHIFIKNNNNIIDYTIPIVLRTNITDHYVTILQVIFQNEHKQKYENTYRTVLNYKKLTNILTNLNWDVVYACDNVESATDMFIKITTDAFKDCTTNIKIKKNKRKRSEWITAGLINSINEKNRLFLETKKYPKNKEISDKYKRYKNKLTNLIRETKIKFYKNKIESSKNDSKKLWQNINALTNKTNSKSNITSLKDQTGNIINNKKEIAALFNNNFAKMGYNLAEKIKSNTHYKQERIRIVNSMLLFPTTVNEVRKVILDLKNTKSTGIDGIKAEDIKKFVDVFSYPLCYIINKILEIGDCPSAFKTSIITPIYKSGVKTETTNYRPISIITNFSKVFEKIVKIRLVKFLDKYNILSPFQFGFRTGKSTQDATLTLANEIYTALDEGEKSLCVFIDLAKAFDTVSHKILFKRLDDIGIRGNVLRLFESYLTGRKQCVKINNCISEFEKIEYGVPQGTVLGPILFLIYVNELFSVQSSGKIISYADDTAIFYKSNSWEELKAKVERDLIKLSAWFNNMLLTINYKKTNYLPFCSYKKSLPNFESIQIHTEHSTHTIEPKTEIKYLGIIFDSHLKWNAHINYVINKLRCIIYRFKYLRDFLEDKQLRQIYHALVQPHLNYGICVWGGALSCHIMPLEIIQKRFIKIMLRKELTYPSNELYQEANLLDPRQLFFLNISIYQHKNQNQLQPVPYTYNTRNKHLSYIIPFPHKTIYQRGYLYLAPKLFSSLPAELKSEQKLSVFKNKLKNTCTKKRELKYTD